MHIRPTARLACAAALLSLSVPVCAQSLEFRRTAGDYDEYRGTVTVSGYYSRIIDDEIIGNQLCFVPTEDSAALIPRKEDDTRMAWFCFADRDAAARALQVTAPPPAGFCGYTGMATLTITGYRVYLPASEGFDLADLVSIERADPPTPSRCDADPR